MCEFCTKHGEGKKWYLQIRNFNYELLSQQQRATLREIPLTVEESWIAGGTAIDVAVSKDPSGYGNYVSSQRAAKEKIFWGQVVPIEDVERILDMSVNIARFPCACRSFVRGVHNARFCFLMNMPDQELRLFYELPDLKNEFEILSPEAAKRVFRDFDIEGQFHHARACPPFVYSICNCNATDCAIMKTSRPYNMPPNFYKAEYVGEVDWEKCNGCRECVRQCNFGAIGYSLAVKKCYINKFQCYGCGVCRSVCDHGAISLKDRNAIPAVANNW